MSVEGRPSQDAAGRSLEVLTRSDRLLEMMATGVVEVDSEGRFTYANPAALRILGATESELVGRTAQQVGIELRHESGAEGASLSSLLVGFAASDAGPLRAIVRCGRPAGHDVWLDAERVGLSDPRGNPAGAVVSFVDVTARHRVEAAERVAVGRISDALDAMIAGVVIVDAEGRIEYSNLAAAAASGLKPDDVIGQLVADPAWQLTDEMGAVLPYDALPVPTALREEREVRGVELGVPTIAGETRWLRVNVQPLFHADGTLRGAVVTTEDVTERRTLTEQLLQAQKIEGIGQLAGGIAHDFNNLLTVIAGNAELALHRLPEGAVTAGIEEIRDAANHGAALTRQLLTFARKQMVQPRPVYLDRLATSVETLLRRVLGEDILLSCVSAPGLWPVKVDPSQLEQVLVNMAINARDAMSRRGELRIATRNVTVDARQAQGHPGVEPGDFVLLSIEDNGSGIPRELVPRIFDPFFTTKPVGSGTGIGLSTCHGVIKQARGFITVSTELGRGTTFDIYLPRCAETPTPESSPPEVESEPRTATVLLVEDQELVRTLLARGLRGYGYEVTAASSGEAALLAYQRMTRPPDLLLTDLVMPGMGGVALARRLQERQPGLPVLYMTGFAEAQDPVLAGKQKGEHVLLKPFTPMQLLKRLQQILGPSDSPPSC